MSSEKKPTEAPRRRYSPEFKAEALGLAEQVGVAGVAKELGLHESQPYACPPHSWSRMRCIMAREAL